MATKIKVPMMAKKPSLKRNSSPSRMTDERKWEVEDAARTLSRAAQVKADKKLMADVKKHEMMRRKEMDKVLKSR